MAIGDICKKPVRFTTDGLYDLTKDKYDLTADNEFIKINVINESGEQYRKMVEITALKAGVGTITATVKDSKESATLKVYVLDKVTNVSLDKKSEMLSGEGEVTVKAKVSPSENVMQVLDWRVYKYNEKSEEYVEYTTATEDGLTVDLSDMKNGEVEATITLGKKVAEDGNMFKVEATTPNNKDADDKLISDACYFSFSKKAPSETFSDVPADKWYGKPNGPVAYVIANKIMSGTGDGSTFDPEGPCTRAMFVQILYNMEGKPAAKSDNPFKDVAENKWYTKSVKWAVQNGVTKGKSADEFGTDDEVSRQMVAQFLMNYANNRGFNTEGRADLSKFPDKDEIAGWARKALEWAKDAGVIGGMGDGRLAPDGMCSRAQIAQMVMNYEKIFGK